MLKRKGFALVQLLVVLAIVGAMTGLVFAWKSYTDGLDAKGYERGKTEVSAALALRENTELVEVNLRLVAAQKTAHDLTVRAARELADSEARHNKEKENAEARTDALVTAARHGELILRDSGERPAVVGTDGDRGAPGGGAAAGPGAGEAGGAQLSGAAAAFLLSLTGEADMLAFRYNRLLTTYGTLESVCR